MKAEFKTSLDKRDIDDKEFYLLSPLIYNSEVTGRTIIAPKGFVSDGSSVPRVPIVFWLFGDKAHHESVIHDYLYRTHETTKEIADLVFQEAMKVRGKSAFVRKCMYWGVKFGGQSSYDSGQSRYRIIAN